MKTLLILFEIKAACAKNGLRRLLSKSRVELFTLVFFFAAACAGLFFFFYQSFRFFHSQEPFGPILIDETFYLFNFALFTMLLISSAVSAYSSLFRSGEVPFLLTRPVNWTDIYFVKLAEALWYSSWSFIFIAAPFMTAYGLVKSAPFWFPALCFIFYIPFIILAASLGTLISTLVVWMLPDRPRRMAAFAILLAGITMLFLKIQPQLIREQGSIAGIMSGYLPHIAFAKNPLLPSSWVTQGILAISQVKTQKIMDWQDGIFYFLLLLSNTLFWLTPSYSSANRLYPAAFLKAQDHGETRKLRRAGATRAFEKFFDLLKWPSRPALGFLEKDIKTFLRDPAEWSQLLIFFGLLLLYFMNLRNLQFHVLKDFWKNLVFVLNTIGTFIVLSSFSMRFVFPMLSMEGHKSWMIGIAPIRYSSLLLEKFFLGGGLSTALTLPLVFLSGWMLNIPQSRILYVLGLGFFVCTALTGLSVGLGAKFINFKSDNPSQIISGFGGSMLLVAHLTYLTGVGAFLFLSKDPQPITFSIMAAASILAGVLPIKLGVSAMQKLEF